MGRIHIHPLIDTEMTKAVQTYRCLLIGRPNPVNAYMKRSGAPYANGVVGWISKATVAAMVIDIHVAVLRIRIVTFVKEASMDFAFPKGVSDSYGNSQAAAIPSRVTPNAEAKTKETRPLSNSDSIQETPVSHVAIANVATSEAGFRSIHVAPNATNMGTEKIENQTLNLYAAGEKPPARSWLNVAIPQEGSWKGVFGYPAKKLGS